MPRRRCHGQDKAIRSHGYLSHPAALPWQAVTPAAHTSVRQQPSPRFLTTSLPHTACLHNEILTRQEKTVQRQWLHTCSKQKLVQLLVKQLCDTQAFRVQHSSIRPIAQTSSKQGKDTHHRCSKFVNSFSGPVKLLQTKMFKRN